MTEEQKLTVTDIERKAIAFCKEKEITFPIANYLVGFATEATKELQEQIEVTARSKDLVINNQLEEINMLKGKIAELEKENTDLEKQIEKMKCCGNCKKEGVCDIDCAKHKDRYHNWELWDVQE